MGSLISRRLQSGSIAVELAFVLGALAMCLSFSSDLNQKTSLQGELDNLSYAMVNVLSEQQLLFNQDGRESSSSSEFREQSQIINQIAKNHLGEYRNHDKSDEFAMVVESIVFEPTTAAKKERIARQRYVIFGNEDLVTYKPDLNELTKLAPFTSKNRFAPMYRVTVFYKSPNIFQRVLSTDITAGVLSSSSFSVGR